MEEVRNADALSIDNIWGFRRESMPINDFADEDLFPLDAADLKYLGM